MHWIPFDPQISVFHHVTSPSSKEPVSAEIRFARMSIYLFVSLPSSSNDLQRVLQVFPKAETFLFSTIEKKKNGKEREKMNDFDEMITQIS
jgi:hypothetical protein